MTRKYKIHTLSVRSILGYAEECDGHYTVRLNSSATRKCFLYRSSEQEDNALFYQTMCVLHGGVFPSLNSQQPVVSDLEDVIFYADFSGIFDHSHSQRYLDRQRKAESLFRPEGIALDFGTGEHTYLAFERSGSMSRQAKLSFLRADVYGEVRRRILLDMTIGECQLSKLYAYLGLTLSGGTRIDGVELTKPHRVIVVDNPSFLVEDVDVITVEGGETEGGMRQYQRREKTMPVTVTAFDGEGLISKQFARTVDKLYCGEHIHSSFQIRMPFVKGMLHQVDFQQFLTDAGSHTITDLWGVAHPVRQVDVILTRSMFKGWGWLSENGMDWNDYLSACQKYDHALYITNVARPEPESFTELNYQFLSTLSMTYDEFRPGDLPFGWSHSPAEDSRSWITKATEQQYYDLCANEKFRLTYFTKRKDALARVLKKNPLFINEPVCTKELDAQADHVLDEYAHGRLRIAGDNRFLSGDLMAFLSLLIETPAPQRGKAKTYYDVAKGEHFFEVSFYAPGAAYPDDGACTLLRNPHIARNEELQLEPYRQKDNMRKFYLGHLTGVVMVDAKMLAAERLGGADYDGDMVKTIADPLLNECVRRNYESGNLERPSNLPLLYIPSEESVMRDANNWHDRFLTVRDTFSTRVGQICNAAFDRSVIAYDENSTSEERQRCKEETETLAILTGLEIDSAKSGVKPNLDKYLKSRTVKRNRYLQFKVLLDDEGDRAWYEPTMAKRRADYIQRTDWDSVTSNVERLPLLAYRLEQETPRIKPEAAEDKDLFTFAQRSDWKERIDKSILASVAALLSDYEACLSRIRACRAPIRTRQKQSDIERILYARGQEDVYDTETLYARFSALSPERAEELRKQLREQSWHLMERDSRLEFLHDQLPEFDDLFPLLSDFRHSGFRVLGDLICDVDDESSAAERKQLHRPGDSADFAEMMQAYIEKPKFQGYREAVSAVCRKRLDKIVKPHFAVFYVVALGKRDLLWNLLPDAVEENVKRYRG